MTMNYDELESLSDATVLVFTQDYPYGRGEQFLEAELGILAARFSQLIIIPVSNVGARGEARRLPANARLLKAGHRSTSRDAARWALMRPIKALGQVASAVCAKSGLAGKWVELKFSIASLLRADKVSSHLGAMLPPNGRVVMYSYWLHLPASVAVAVRLRIAALEGVPIVSRAHGFDVYTERSASNYLPQRQQILSNVEHIFSVSQAGAEYLQTHWPSFADKISTARLGVASASNPRNPRRASRVLVSCSFIVPVKRIDRLIDAISVVQARGIELHWYHIGSAETSFAKEIREYASERLHSDTFEFVGALTNREVRDWYATFPASLFINVSESEGIPVSIMEALAQGLPVLATDVGGNSETIDVARGMFDGLLPAHPTSVEIADRIELLLSADETLYRQYVEGSYSYWEKAWQDKTNFSTFAAILDDLAVLPQKS